MIKIENIEKEKENWRNNKFACTKFCFKNDIDVNNDDTIEDEINDVLWSIAKEDENYENMPINEISEYLKDVTGIILDGVINAR